MKIDIEDWINSNLLKVEFYSDGFLKLEDVDKVFYVLPYREKLFNDELYLKLTEEEIDDLDSFEDHTKLNIVFQFGDLFFYTPSKKKKDEFNELKYVIEQLNDFLYIGKSDTIMSQEVVLGLHSEYEILNSALNFTNAIKKAKFLGVKKLAICDKNTLGGTLGFQLQCNKMGIKPIIGETVTVAYDYDPNKKIQITHELKLYCTSEQGWFNLLTINKTINVDHKGIFIPEYRLLELSEGLVCVFDYSNSVLRDVKDEKEYNRIIKLYKKSFHSVYYQLSTVEYSSDTYDLACLNGFKNYLQYSDKLPFVQIDDVYYLEKNQSDCKVAVNNISKKVYQHSHEQYFKSLQEIRAKLEPLFSEKHVDFVEFFSKANYNCKVISEACDFEIPTEGAKLPKFEMDGIILETEEGNELLRMLFEDGFQKKVVGVVEDDKIKTYRDRIEREFQVIVKGNLSDYFLILWDAVNFAKESNVMIGIGRGSVGGSLLAYLIGIIRIDPIKYDLLFERFLNETRITPEKFFILKMVNGQEMKFKEGQKVNTENGEKLVEYLIEGDKVIL